MARLSLPVGVTATGLSMEDNTPLRKLWVFIDSVLRGIGQVMLQNNSYTGLLFLVGIFYSSALFGWATVLGTAISTLTAMLLGVNHAHIRAGLFGFNGALAAIAVLNFFEPSYWVWGYAALAAVCTTVVMAAFMRLSGILGIPTLTAPFVLVTLGFVLTGSKFSYLVANVAPPIAELSPSLITTDSMAMLTTVTASVLLGVAQVFFQDTVVTGILFLLGLAVSSHSACVAAVLGSLLGWLVAWMLGANDVLLNTGAYGFNAVLTAIALGSGFYVLNVAAIVYVALAAAASTIAFAALSTALAPLGASAMTLPFVLVTWLFLLASPLFGRLRQAAG